MPTPSKSLTAALMTAALASTGVALAAGSPAAAATDTTPGYSVQSLTVPVKVGPNNEQSCTIDADLYLPDGASASHKVPAILSTHGFGGDKADSNQTAIGKGFVGQGYAVLSYSGLGFGKTDCKIQLDDPDWDGKAGKQMVDVLAGKRAYTPAGTSTPKYLRSIATETAGDPRVGMIGGSYGGQIQYAVAKQDPRIDAIIPIITWNDLTYSLAPNGVAKKQWIDLFFGAGIISGAENASADPATMVGCPNFTNQACVGVTALNTLGYPDAGTSPSPGTPRWRPTSSRSRRRPCWCRDRRTPCSTSTRRWRPTPRSRRRAPRSRWSGSPGATRAPARSPASSTSGPSRCATPTWATGS